MSFYVFMIFYDSLYWNILEFLGQKAVFQAVHAGHCYLSGPRSQQCRAHVTLPFAGLQAGLMPNAKCSAWHQWHNPGVPLIIKRHMVTCPATKSTGALTAVADLFFSWIVPGVLGLAASIWEALERAMRPRGYGAAPIRGSLPKCDALCTLEDAQGPGLEAPVSLT